MLLQKQHQIQFTENKNNEINLKSTFGRGCILYMY